MKSRNSLCALAGAGLLLAMATPPAHAQTPETWDGLIHVKSGKLKNVYLEPYADFRVYTKVMLVPPEVSFRTDWDARLAIDNTRTARTSSASEARKMLDDVEAGLFDIFARQFQQSGYTLVNTPGPDVMRVAVAIQNLAISEPDNGSFRNRSATPEAGEARLVVEARDSLSRELLGRAFESRIVGENGQIFVRTSVTNRRDFERAFERWAKVTVDGIDELKALSPIDPEGKLKR